MIVSFRSPSFRLLSLIFFSFWYVPAWGQDASGAKANKQVITRYFSELNAQNLGRVGTFFSRDYTWHQMNGTDVRGNQDSAHSSALKFVFTAIPDIHYTLDNMIAEGDMVAVNSTITGTAKGEMFGFAATPRKVRFKQMFFFRLVNNKITEEWQVADLDGLKTQLSKE